MGRQRAAGFEQSGQFVAERVDPGLEAVIEHVADHDHAALRPLPHAAELGVVELSLTAVSLGERGEKDERRFEAETVTLCDVRDDAEVLRA